MSSDHHCAGHEGGQPEGEQAKADAPVSGMEVGPILKEFNRSERIAYFSMEIALQNDIPIVFLPNYDMKIAPKLVSGSDVWLNTPLRPFEASGTSGMKATFNGVPNLSVLDGWWVEGCIEGVTGWAVGNSDESDNGEDAISLYRKLDEVVLPLYHEDRDGWISVMQRAISKNASIFNSHRMMRRYAADAYIR